MYPRGATQARQAWGEGLGKFFACCGGLVVWGLGRGGVRERVWQAFCLAVAVWGWGCERVGVWAWELPALGVLAWLGMGFGVKAPRTRGFWRGFGLAVSLFGSVSLSKFYTNDYQILPTWVIDILPIRAIITLPTRAVIYTLLRNICYGFFTYVAFNVKKC